jgi:hypothetical protein
MYHITGATMSIACLCTAMGQMGVVPDHAQYGSIGLIGIMLIPNIIARIAKGIRKGPK